MRKKNVFNTRLAGLLMAGLLVLATLNSCMKDDDYEEVPVGVVTTVNGYVSSNGVIYAVDNNTVQFNYDPLVQYKEYNAFRIFQGNRRFRIFTETEDPLVDETYNFKENTYYTSFVYGWQEDIRHLLTEDQLLESLGSESGMRFFHLSPSEGKVNVYLDNEETLLYGEREYEGGDNSEEVEDNDHATFVAQSSGKHTIIITDEAGETLVEREYTFKQGWHYSIILIGDDSMARPLYIGIVEQYQS